MATKPVLYDMPVSNNGARNRLVVYWKGMEDRIDIKSPMELGGLKSDDYLALNPQGKMPLLVLPDGTALPESEVISQYLVAKYADMGPSLLPLGGPEVRAKAALATRIHDVYITSVQACMYRAMEVQEREAGVKQIAAQLAVLENLCEAGPFFVGAQPTTTDAALFPTFCFLNFILPRSFGWVDVFAGKPQLKAWWETMMKDPQGSRVYTEINDALQGWADSGRWEKLGIDQQIAENTDVKWAY